MYLISYARSFPMAYFPWLFIMSVTKPFANVSESDFDLYTIHLELNNRA